MDLWLDINYPIGGELLLLKDYQKITYVEQQSEFLSYVLYLRKENDYPLSLIENIDETPMVFNLPSNTTIE